MLPQFLFFVWSLLNFSIFSLFAVTLLLRAITATTTETVCIVRWKKNMFRWIVRWNRSNAREELITSHWSVKYERKTSFYVKYLLNFTLNGTPVNGMHGRVSTSSEKRLNYQWNEWKNGSAIENTVLKATQRATACTANTHATRLHCSTAMLILFDGKIKTVWLCLHVYLPISMCICVCVLYSVHMQHIFYLAKWSDNSWFSTIVAWTTQQFTDWIFY